ncbi:MAG TPA: hypothetical protein P5556_06960 [Candidatus Gastranaerophilales bacterium]|nr:hypothetical protein [Candidatus Gastranaerophilales bacterium]
MITLDANLGLPSSSSFFYLIAKLRKQYGCSNTNIDNSTEAYAAKGTPDANKTENTDNVNNINDLNIKENLDFEQLVEDLKLNVSENRFALLLMMPSSELFQLLELLGKENLLNGLKFFTKEKIMGFIAKLPKKDLLKMLFYMFTDKKQLIENLPLKELHNFLSSDKIEKGHFMKIFELLPRQTLAIIAGHLTGKKCDKMSQKDLLKEIEPFKKYQMTNGVKKLDEKTLRGFVTTLTESFPNLYNEFSHIALFNVSAKFAKTDLIDAMTVIDNSKIMDMLSELPDKLLALTVSQIDPEIFANVLLADHKDLLANLVMSN